MSMFSFISVYTTTCFMCLFQVGNRSYRLFFYLMSFFVYQFQCLEVFVPLYYSVLFVFNFKAKGVQFYIQYMYLLLFGASRARLKEWFSTLVEGLMGTSRLIIFSPPSLCSYIFLAFSP